MNKKSLLTIVIFFLSLGYVSAATFDDIDAAYKFNLTDAFADSSLNNADCVNTSILGVTNEANCKSGTCLDFTGTGSVAKCYLKGWTAPMSFSIWFNSDDTSNVDRIMGYGEDGDVNFWQFQIETNNLKFSMKEAAGYRHTTVSAFSDTTNWHNIIFVYPTANKELTYLDGVLKNNLSYTPQSTAKIEIMIGAHDRGANQYFFDGMIDEFYVFNKSLSQAEITALQTEFYFVESEVTPVSLYLNSSLEDDAAFDDLILNISYNGTFADANTTIATCSLWENNVLVNQSTGNISYNNFFVIDTSFRDGTYLYSINCSNYEIYANTSVFTYVMDTYSKSLAAYVIENNEKINEIYTEVMTMIPIILLYLGLLFFGYWMITTYNFWLGMPLILGTMMFDVHLAAIYYNTYLGVGAFFLVMLLGKIPMMWFLRGRRIKG